LQFYLSHFPLLVNFKPLRIGSHDKGCLYLSMCQNIYLELLIYFSFANILWHWILYLELSVIGVVGRVFIIGCSQCHNNSKFFFSVFKFGVALL
jgi:hypothetical protein